MDRFSRSCPDTRGFISKCNDYAVKNDLRAPRELSFSSASDEFSLNDVDDHGSIKYVLVAELSCSGMLCCSGDFSPFKAAWDATIVSRVRSQWEHSTYCSLLLVTLYR